MSVAIAAPTFHEISDHVTEARRQLAAGKKLSDLEPAQREAYLDVEAIKLDAACKSQGQNTSRVLADALVREPVVKLDSIRRLRERF